MSWWSELDKAKKKLATITGLITAIGVLLTIGWKAYSFNQWALERLNAVDDLKKARVECCGLSEERAMEITKQYTQNIMKEWKQTHRYDSLLAEREMNRMQESIKSLWKALRQRNNGSTDSE